MKFTEEMKIWLFDLAHGNLKHNEVIKGFIEHYAINDMGMGDVKRHILFHTNYGDVGAQVATESLLSAFKTFGMQT